MSSTAPTPALPLDGPDPSPDELVEDDVLGLDGLELVAGPTSPEHGLLTRVGAEVIGTLGIVLAVVGTLLYTGLSGAGAVGVALAGGAALAGLTATFGRVSGAHFNPAVTLAAALTGRTAWIDALLYVVAQVLGAVIAVAVLFVTVPAALPGLVDTVNPDATAADFLAITANGWGAGSPLSVLSSGSVTFGLTAALLVEALATALLVAVVIGTSGRRSGAVAIGLTYASMLLVAAPVTNAALNPARATAVALLSAGSDTLALTQLWGFWLAALLGGAAVGLAVLAFGRTVTEPIEIVLEETTESVVVR